MIALLALALVVGIIALDQQRRHPERLPWTPLSLSTPIGGFTGTKVARLTEDAPQCRRLLAEAGADLAPAPLVAGEQCGYADGVMLQPVGTLATEWQPARLAVACPVAAAVFIWDREVVRPAALRHFGAPLAEIQHLGSFNCRRIAGSSSWSEHATADAIDIAGFRLEDGHQIRVLANWHGTAAEAAFLREVRDGACQVFATVLSPDYNAAHADHLHLDQAARGRTGNSVCR